MNAWTPSLKQDSTQTHRRTPPRKVGSQLAPRALAPGGSHTPWRTPPAASALPRRPHNATRRQPPNQLWLCYGTQGRPWNARKGTCAALTPSGAQPYLIGGWAEPLWTQAAGALARSRARTWS